MAAALRGILTVSALTGGLTLTIKLLLAVIRLLEIIANPGSRHVSLIIGIYLKIFIRLRLNTLQLAAGMKGKANRAEAR